MIGTPRERARAATMEEITRIGREHLALHGAAALSLRAVARDLGVVSSAIYRYVASRDDLLTLLLVDAYGELGDAVDAAVDGVPAERHRERFLALGRAVRGWAIAEPAPYALLFGAPVPGYRAPEARTVEPGTRVPRRMIRIAADALAAGALTAPAPALDAPVPAALAVGLDAVREQAGADLPDDLLVRGVLAWSALFGCVSFEVFGQYGPDRLGDPDALFERHLAVLADDLGLSAASSRP
ncbi:TetR family transcriptional regulator [Nocardioides sp. GY 10113]|uniref:TetR/AcrR family transcriptional regulator n=1 Tax=Nocardioides sp. GY 10113 TaxID=2569761 RepID=UPI0010A8E932|nr:TetR-like C-terminal domain-containing protein [Nocardioides sp. GY 10113]TIC86736.1 TetR family transcriptional regulator [Nocardioides sp. GY 10113]